MTEITKFNFETSLAELFEDIRHADFVALDTNAEVTGFLTIDESIPQKLFQKNWYKHIVENQKTRSPVDLGISIFRRVPKVQLCGIGIPYKFNNFVIKSFSIPIVCACVDEHDARTESRRAKSTEDRLDFDGRGQEFMQLIELDLNKVLYVGTPFTNLEREEAAKVYMEQNPDFMVISGTHTTNGDLDEHYFPKLIPSVDANDIKEINNRLRGIAKIFDILQESKIPVVGHNLLVKLLLLYKDFVRYLPETFQDFVVKLEAILPQFYDTKFIAAEILSRDFTSDYTKKQLSSLKLFELYRELDLVGRDQLYFLLEEKTEEFYKKDLQVLRWIQLEDDCDSFCHESGFDATVAGILFFKLIFIDIRQSLDVQQKILLDKDFFRSKINPAWKNKMFMQKQVLEQLQFS